MSWLFYSTLAEREGFEPPIRLPVCRISSAVHSTTLPPLQAIDNAAQSALTLIEEGPVATLLQPNSFTALVYYLLESSVNAPRQRLPALRE
jgi:hypothetical protein